MALGYDWTTLATTTVYRANGSETFYVEAKLNRQENNYSVIDTRSRSTVVNPVSGAGYSFYLTGASERSGTDVWTFDNETILTGQYVVYHDEHGNASTTVTGGFHNTYWNIHEEISGSISLPRIPKAPFVSNLNIENVTHNSADASFTITDNGGSSVTGSSIELYLNNELIKTINGTSGTFTNLKAKTQYSAKGKAINSVGTRYTSVANFTTDSPLLYLKINNIWKTGIPYIKVNGEWKTGIPYIKINGEWRSL